MKFKLQFDKLEKDGEQYILEFSFLSRDKSDLQKAMKEYKHTLYVGIKYYSMMENIGTMVFKTPVTITPESVVREKVINILKSDLKALCYGAADDEWIRVLPKFRICHMTNRHFSLEDVFGNLECDWD